jgi:hypothetical protein
LKSAQRPFHGFVCCATAELCPIFFYAPEAQRQALSRSLSALNGHNGAVSETTETVATRAKNASRSLAALGAQQRIPAKSQQSPLMDITPENSIRLDRKPTATSRTRSLGVAGGNTAAFSFWHFK